MSDIDDKLDAAWRAANREEPPAALDDSIRAAARRAVGAGPTRARHMRSWPLAAAAVVAVLAIGIVQLTPPEQVTPTIVADGASRQVAPKEQDAMAPAAAPATIVAAARPAAQVAATSAPIDRESSMPRKQLAQPSVAPPSNPAVALTDNRRAAAPSGGSAAATGVIAPAPERDLAAPNSKLDTAAAETSAKKERAEPFPAAPAELKSAADAPAPMAPPPVLAGASRPAPAAPGATALAARAARSDAAPAAAPTLLAKVAPERERAKDSAPRPPDEWIKLIRRLQNEGRKEEAAKELAAFRAEYKERADALLPADLREAK